MGREDSHRGRASVPANSPESVAPGQNDATAAQQSPPTHQPPSPQQPQVDRPVPPGSESGPVSAGGESGPAPAGGESGPGRGRASVPVSPSGQAGDDHTGDDRREGGAGSDGPERPSAQQGDHVQATGGGQLSGPPKKAGRASVPMPAAWATPPGSGAGQQPDVAQRPDGGGAAAAWPEGGAEKSAAEEGAAGDGAGVEGAAAGLRPAVGRVSVARPVGIDRGAAGSAGPGGSPADGPGQPGTSAPGVGGQPAGAATGEPSRTRRTLWVSGLLGLILIVAVGVATFIMRPGPVAGWLADDPAPTPSATVAPEPTPTPVLVAADEGAAAPSAAGVQRAIKSLVGAPALGSRVRVSVVDAATGATLFSQGAGTPTTPASTTKLVTAATVLAARGPAYRLTTRAVAGVQSGEVVLVGGGDPTLAVDAKGQFPGAARLDRLAEQVRKAMGDTPITRVLIDTSMFTGPATGKGWNSTIIAPEGQVSAITPLMTNAGRRAPVHHEVGGDPRFTDPALAAGQAFARELKVKAKVTRGTAPAAAPASSAPGAVAPGTELGVVQSPPLVHVVDWMLEQSDNTIAEVLARQVALAAGEPASFDGASRAMIAKLTELGLPADQVKLSDASGLSRLNQISPGLLTQLLTVAANGEHPALTPLFGGLPVAGWSGTLRTRFVTPSPNRAGQGLVRAKTGSLTGVNTIAGQLVTNDGRLLVFAIMADRTGDSTSARQALDKVATRLVACGC